MWGYDVPVEPSDAALGFSGQQERREPLDRSTALTVFLVMPTSSKRKDGKGRSALIFETENYILFAVSVLLIVAGFVAMYLDGQFLGFISLTVSPLVILAGYATLVYAILRRPGDSSSTLAEETSSSQ